MALWLVMDRLTRLENLCFGLVDHVKNKIFVTLNYPGILSAYPKIPFCSKYRNPYLPSQ